MKLSICIAVMGQLEDTKAAWGTLLASTTRKQDVELVVIDNGSTDGTRPWLERFVFPHFPTKHVIVFTENQGVVKSLATFQERASGDVLAILHNDVFLFEHGWNERVLQAFAQDDRLGLAGFLGAQGIAQNGGRVQVYSNLLEAEIHGSRETGNRPVAVFDGLALIARKQMLIQTGGFDEGYAYHHFYDKDISLTSLVAGWHNLLVGVLCHHRSGVTANRPDYQAWISQKMNTAPGEGDLASYKQSEQRFLEKWEAHLPTFV